MPANRRSDAASRAALRKTWPVRTFRLHSTPSDDLSACTTPEQRLEMMWPLAVEAWLLAGRAVPDYPRDGAPVCKSRRRVS